jgi:hypothetical protein
VLQGPLQRVRHRHQVAGELLDRIGAAVVGLAFGPAPAVLGVGGDAQHLVLQGDVLGSQQVEFGGVLGGVFGHVVGIAFLAWRVIVHRFSLIRP